MERTEHDPGGKTRLKVASDIHGSAVFSECGRYRPLLTRQWIFGDAVPSVLFIGMNPSTADPTHDDPTVAREVGFSRRWGFGRYVKCNVSDYRATNPKDMVRFINAGGAAASPDNLPTILREAEQAQLVVMACGAVHKHLQPLARNIVDELTNAGHRLFCLGRTRAGWGRHPLYLSNDAALAPFNEVPQ